jgi:hypothetical protein
MNRSAVWAPHAFLRPKEGRGKVQRPAGTSGAAEGLLVTLRPVRKSPGRPGSPGFSRASRHVAGEGEPAGADDIEDKPALRGTTITSVSTGYPE